MPDSTIPYYQAGLGNRLCYEITFNDYDQVILLTGVELDASYKMSDMSSEYEIVNHSNVTKHILEKYQNAAFCMTEFSDTDRLEWNQTRHGIGNLIHLVNH